MSNPTSTKVGHIFCLMQKIYDGEELYAQKYVLSEELGVDERTLRRYLDEIYKLYGHIILTEKKQVFKDGRRIMVYRRVNEKQDLSKVVRFFMEETSELSWVLPLILENDPALLHEEKKSIKEAVKKMVAQDKDVFLFRSNPFENLGDSTLNEHFSKLKKAVKERECRTIVYMYESEEVLEDAKCLKLIFSENNWYVAVETKEEQLRLLRVAFIKEMRHSKKQHAFPLHVLAKYHRYFETIQNPFSLHGVTQQTAILKASPKISRYFKEGMKRFFLSQQFVQECEDGSVVFRVDYTQEMEILPFVRRWMPELCVLEPESLRGSLVKDLEMALAAYR